MHAKTVHIPSRPSRPDLPVDLALASPDVQTYIHGRHAVSLASPCPGPARVYFEQSRAGEIYQSHAPPTWSWKLCGRCWVVTGLKCEVRSVALHFCVWCVAFSLHVLKGKHCGSSRE
jgi:hypothetical protein